MTRALRHLLRGPLPWLLLLTAPVTLVGCSAESTFFQDKDDMSGASDTAEAPEDAGLDTVRLDVYPSDASGGVAAQTVFAELTRLDGGDIALRAPVSVRGTVTGYKATPPSAIEVPGEDTPVVAEVRLDEENGISDAGTTSDADGDFSMAVTPSDGYVLSVIPLDPENLPFLVLSDLSIDDDLPLDADDLDLGYGNPVYGLVTKSDGTPVTADVSLIDAATGVRGPSVETDASGYYQLRALPGSYVLEVEGASGFAVPTIRKDIEVVENEGVNADADMGDFQPVSFVGEVVDTTGKGVPGVTVRFTSIELEDGDWSLERETQTDSSSVVNTRLLPGTWHVEVIPDYSAELSPVSLDIEVDTTEFTLDEPVVLPSLSLLSALVLDPHGSPMSGVVVAATEQGFDGRTWTGVTDTAGLISLEVPATALSLSLSPPSDEAAVTRLDLDTPADMPESIQLSAGYPISGRLVVGDEEVPYALIEIRNPDTGALLGSALAGSDGTFSLNLQP